MMMDRFLFSVVVSITATVVVLLTRMAFYRIVDLFPARALFKNIVGSDTSCLVFVPRLTDLAKEGKFVTPLPRWAVATSQSSFECRQLTPWVTSTSETQSIAFVLNVLGRAGRTKNIELAYVDQDYDKWNVPMFILGGSWKATRAFEVCNPNFTYQNSRFVSTSTAEEYVPKTIDHDLGLLQKMVNAATGLPVWVAMGWRGAGTMAATYALARWWRELGFLYGSKCFGLLLELDDRDGWQQFVILRLEPEPTWRRKCLYPLAWMRLKRGLPAGDRSHEATRRTATAKRASPRRKTTSSPE